MWWTALIQVVQQQSAAPQLAPVAPQSSSGDWLIAVGALAGLGVAGYVAYRVLR